MKECLYSCVVSKNCSKKQVMESKHLWNQTIYSNTEFMLLVGCKIGKPFFLCLGVFYLDLHLFALVFLFFDDFFLFRNWWPSPRWKCWSTRAIATTTVLSTSPLSRVISRLCRSVNRDVGQGQSFGFNLYCSQRAQGWSQGQSFGFNLYCSQNAQVWTTGLHLAMAVNLSHHGVQPLPFKES